MSNLKKVDGRFVIASRASYTPEQREVLTGKKHSANAAGPVTLTPTPLYEKLKLKNRIAQLKIQLAVKAGEESAAPSEKKTKRRNIGSTKNLKIKRRQRRCKNKSAPTLLNVLIKTPI